MEKIGTMICIQCNKRQIGGLTSGLCNQCNPTVQMMVHEAAVATEIFTQDELDPPPATQHCCSCGEKIEYPGDGNKYTRFGFVEEELRHWGCSPRIVYVNAYSVTRHYGGGEEGGWWYNAHEPLASVPIGKDTDPEFFRLHLLKLYADTKQGNIYSVLGGIELEIMVEEEEAAYRPAERPHYE